MSTIKPYTEWRSKSRITVSFSYEYETSSMCLDDDDDPEAEAESWAQDDAIQYVPQPSYGTEIEYDIEIEVLEVEQIGDGKTQQIRVQT